MKTRILYTVLCLVALSSCTSGLEKYGATFSSLMKNDKSVFRGLKPGDTRDFVRRSEVFEPIVNDENQLSYEIPLTDDGSIIVNYNFEGAILFEINMELLVVDDKVAEKIISDLKKYYDDNYGKHVEESGFLVWKIENDSNMIAVEMTNESEFFDFGKWSFIVYDYTHSQSKKP